MVIDACIKNSDLIRRFLALSDTLEEQVTEEEELQRWIENAQKVGEQMSRLREEARLLKLRCIAEAHAGEDRTLVEAVVDFFKAENDYFELIRRSEENTSVEIFRTGSAQQRQWVQERRAFGETLWESFRAVCSKQQALLALAESRGLGFTPAWDDRRQQVLLSAYAEIREFDVGL